MSDTGTVFSINVSRGGVPKLPIAEAEVGYRGITADAQADRRAHGSPEQALCLWAVERIETLRAEGHNVYPGSTGENITTHGLDWDRIVPGMQMRLGEDVVIEFTDYATPCWKNACWFRDGDFDRIHHARHPGFSRLYARILEPGHIRAGDPVELIPVTAVERVRKQQPLTYRWPRDFQ